jgi:hypothetical protein
MELHIQTEDIPVIGIHVKTFPSGIKANRPSYFKTKRMLPWLSVWKCNL